MRNSVHNIVNIFFCIQSLSLSFYLIIYLFFLYRNKNEQKKVNISIIGTHANAWELYNSKVFFSSKEIKMKWKKENGTIKEATFGSGWGSGVDDGLVGS